jgi:membrane-associated protein
VFNVTHLIETGGLLFIAAIIFAESGMMVGFFFPGDTLLLSAGVLAAGHKLPLLWAIIVIAAAAIAGDNTGYQIGKSLGHRLFTKKDGLVFRKEYIERAELFYEKHGSKTMLLAHFIPVVRSFAPVTAGAAKMPRKLFILYDAIGDIAWATLLTLFGYFVGSKVPGIDKYIEPLLVVIIIIFVAPTLFHILRDPKIRAAFKSKFKR